jgi:predicted HAD superfamily Cof-like phosphohydrolase
MADFHAATGVLPAAVSDAPAALLDDRAELLATQSASAVAMLRDLAMAAHPAGQATTLRERTEYRDVAQAVAGELAALLYAVYGTAELLDIDMYEAFTALHRRRMAALPPTGNAAA